MSTKFADLEPARTFRALREKPECRAEERSVFLRRKGGIKLSNQVKGVAYVLAQYENLNDMQLWIDGRLVAEGGVELLAWALENCPKSLMAAYGVTG